MKRWSRRFCNEIYRRSFIFIRKKKKKKSTFNVHNFSSNNSFSFHGVNKLFIPSVFDDHLFPRYTLLHDSCSTLMQRRIQLTNNYIIPNYCYEARNDRSSFQERYERLSKRSQHASPTGPGNSHVASSTPLSKATSATACHSSPSFRHTGHECTNPSESHFTRNVCEQSVIGRLEQCKSSSLFLSYSFRLYYIVRLICVKWKAFNLFEFCLKTK